MHRQEAFSGIAYNDNNFEVANKLCDTVLSLPMHPYLRDSEIRMIVEALKTSHRSS